MVLSKISGNAQPRELSLYERAQIITLHDMGLGTNEIQSFIQTKYSLQCFRSTIHCTIQLEPERIQGHSLKDGKERKTTREQDLRLAELALEDPDQSVIELAT